MWEGHKVAYVCATFFGTRKGQKPGTKNDYSDVYLEHIAKNSTCIDEIVIGCNLEPGHEVLYDAFVAKMREKEEVVGLPIRTFSRENTNFSYGSWDLALREHCDGYTFAFLMEDDYIPCKVGYDKELLSRYYSDPETMERLLFCASWYKLNDRHLPHAAISNGLINVNVFKNNGNKFYLHPQRGRNEGPLSQAEFLTSFFDKDLWIRDMAIEYRMPFIDNLRRIKHYGNTDAHILLAPKEIDFAVVREANSKPRPEAAPFENIESYGFRVLHGGC